MSALRGTHRAVLTYATRLCCWFLKTALFAPVPDCNSQTLLAQTPVDGLLLNYIIVFENGN